MGMLLRREGRCQNRDNDEDGHPEHEILFLERRVKRLAIRA